MPKNSLIFIGLGLNDEKDISLKGLEEIKNCNKIFAEFYTAKLVGTTIEKIEEETWLVASVRSNKAAQKRKISTEQKRVLDAVQNRKFNKDEINEFKRTFDRLL